eukprot:GHVS01010259.1.p1 GENE.GHVS01010259.1~~GHVS01010259.1.p1  ORF type:complete len:218 (-),score=26.40 GHVS01010259.1:442-1095(-)
MAHFSDTGQHCSDPYCRQHDFLPFSCGLCNQVFCLSHFPPASHSCPNESAGDRRVLICPLCLGTVHYQDQPSDVVWQKHKESADCRRDLYAERKSKTTAKCPVNGCREKLTAITRYDCKKCHTVVCMKHRLPEDHCCEVAAAAHRAQWSMKLWGGSKRSSKSAAPPPGRDQLRDTAHRRQPGNNTRGAPQTGNTRTSQQQRSGSSSSSSKFRGCGMQ